MRSDSRKRAFVRQLRGPSAREMQSLTRSFSRTPRQLYVYRDSPESEEIIVSNYPMESRADRLVGVYDRGVTTAMLRADLYGIEEEEYRSTVQWGAGRPRRV